jgi:micrococcal nuclease
MKRGTVSAYHIIASLCIILFYGGYDARAETSGYVRWVDDGDTIVLADGRRVRYIGINTPEIGHADIKPEPLGPEAKNFNKKMVFQAYVRLEFDKEKIDHYGRSLAYIFNPANIFINKEILLRGFGHFLYRYPNIKYQAILLEAQRSAMKAQKGIWRDWKEMDERYIGNKGSRRFHLGNCPLAQKISLDNRINFKKRWDAFWQGYSPAKNCLPGGLSQ